MVVQGLALIAMVAVAAVVGSRAAQRLLVQS